MSKTPQKCQKRQLLSKSQGGVCNILFTAMILGSEVAQGVYNNLRKQLQSYLWSPGKYWQKRFGHFHQFWAFFTINVSNFSKHFISQKAIAMVVWSFHDTLLKWNIQMTHLHIGQHLVNIWSTLLKKYIIHQNEENFHYTLFIQAKFSLFWWKSCICCILNIWG